MEDLDSAVVLGMAAQAPDGIVITDSEGLIRYWNRGAERIFGFPAADVTGRSLDVIIPERHRKRHQEGFDAAMERGYSKYGDADLLNVPALAVDGRKLSIEFSVVLLPGVPAALSTCTQTLWVPTGRSSRLLKPWSSPCGS